MCVYAGAFVFVCVCVCVRVDVGVWVGLRFSSEEEKRYVSVGVL